MYKTPFLLSCALLVILVACDAANPTDMPRTQTSPTERAQVATNAATNPQVTTATTSALQDSATNTDNIRLLVGGIPRPFSQGTVLPVVGNVMGVLTMRATEVVFVRSFDLFLYQETPSSHVDDADVQVLGQMPDMAHGEFRLLALPMGDGHYSVNLPCGMNGQWEFDVEIITQGAKGTIKLLVDIFE